MERMNKDGGRRRTVKFVVGERGSGKSTKMITVSSITGYPIVVDTEIHKRNLLDMAAKEGVKIPTPIVTQGLSISGLNLDTVLIDDGERIIEDALKRLLGVKSVMAVSVLKD